MIAFSGASEPRCDHPERSEGSSYQLAAFSTSPRIYADERGSIQSVKIRQIRGFVFGFESGVSMQFQVNGQEYFLAFVEKENKLYVLSPTETGLVKMAVYVDGAKQEFEQIVETGERSVQ